MKTYDKQKILDDIKIIAKAVHITREENNPENRKYACGLVENLLNRLYNDIIEMTSEIKINDEYDGSGHVKLED